MTEADLTQALELGAQDVVTLRARPRLQAVATRELHSSRLDRALAGTLASARQYRDQMKAFMTGSTDAIAHVQEGIVVDVNPAWVELFGHEEAAALLGQPLMDFFQQRSHTALKGALVAAAQGRWADHSLQAVALLPGGTELPVDIEFERFEFEGEPAVRLRVPTQKARPRDADPPARRGAAVRRGHRPAEARRLRRAGHGACGAGAEGRPARARVPRAGPARRARGRARRRSRPRNCWRASGSSCARSCSPGDMAGRVTARGFALLVERGNARDLEAWVGARAAARSAEHVFHVGERSVSVTCSAGATLLNAHGEVLPRRSNPRSRRRAAAAAPAATGCCARSRPARSRSWRKRTRAWASPDQVGTDGEPLPARAAADREPGRRGRGDVRPRRAHARRAQGKEVLPSEFLAAAQRTDLMKNIDRWVVGAAMSFCAARKPHRVFVRLSRDSMRDQTLGTWLQQQLKASGVGPGRVVWK